MQYDFPYKGSWTNNRVDFASYIGGHILLVQAFESRGKSSPLVAIEYKIMFKQSQLVYGLEMLQTWRILKIHKYKKRERERETFRVHEE